MRAQLLAMVPAGVLSRYRGLRRKVEQTRNRFQGSERIFTSIYNRHAWGVGTDTQKYCSGTGSYGIAAADFVDYVAEFVSKHNITSIVDLGCGDFNVGRQLMARVPEFVTYIGVDIVASVVQENTQLYGTSRIQFKQSDCTKGGLPRGELLLIRQVLQHLSNSDIAKILHVAPCYGSVVVAEHHPADIDFSGPNKDKVTGGDTRVLDGSGVYLDLPPFNADFQLTKRLPLPNHLVSSGEYLAVYTRTGPPQTASGPILSSAKP